MRSLSKLTICLFLSLSILCTIGDVQGAAYKAGVYILTQDMKLRNAPKTTGKFLNTIKKGTKVTVKKVVETKWGLVTYKKKTGYISLKYAKLVKAAQKTATKTAASTKTYKKGTYRLTAQRAVRASPKNDSKYLGTLKKGKQIVVKAVKNTKWGQVTYKKKTAYVSLKCAKYLNASTKLVASKPKTIAGMLAASKTGKKTSQIITVIPNGKRSRGYRLYNVIFWQKSKGKWKKVISVSNGRAGKKGLKRNRVEGDKTTPIGSFKLTMAFGRPRNPGTKMTYKRITRNSWWGGTKWGKYAQRWYEGKRLAKGGERLYSFGSTYKYCMNIGYNMNPVIDGKGSCIFLHCFSGRPYTSGCVSVSSGTMLKFLKKAKNGAYIIIVPSQGEILNY